MSDIIFREFGKISRLSRECVVTEKIDGTNACVVVGAAGEVRAQSRNRLLNYPHDDNFGFATWVHEHERELAGLGPGHHFGEWWGVGIQRGYGLHERRFSLFNVERWAENRPVCCHVVPVFYRGVFDSAQIEFCLSALRVNGSAAAPGFAQPEGVVVYHTASGHLYKKTCEHDAEPKGAHIKKDRPPRAPKNPDVGGRRKENLGRNPDRRAV